MKNKELLKQELEEKQSKLQELQDELIREEKPLDNDPHYIEVYEKILDLENEIGSVDAPQAPKGLTVGIVISAIMIAVGFFISKYISFAAVAAVIVLCIIRSVLLKKAQNEIDILQAPSKKKLADLQSEYDSMRRKYPKIQIIEGEMSRIGERISTLKTQITAIENEEIAMKKALGTNNIEQYEKNHLFIHIGRHTTSSNESMLLRHNLIIDGQDYGPASLPFSKFEMNPGVHNIMIKYQLADSIYQSQAIQFKADEQTKMIVVKYNSGRIFSTEFTDFCKFIDGITKL